MPVIVIYCSSPTLKLLHSTFNVVQSNLNQLKLEYRKTISNGNHTNLPKLSSAQGVDISYIDISFT